MASLPAKLMSYVVLRVEKGVLTGAGAGKDSLVKGWEYGHLYRGITMSWVCIIYLFIFVFWDMYNFCIVEWTSGHDEYTGLEEK